MGEVRWELTVCSGPFAFHGRREKGAGVGGAVWRCDCQPENRLQRWERCSEIPHSTFSEVAACWHRQFVRCSPKPEETVMVVGSVHGAASFAFSGLICPAKARVTRGLLAQRLTCFPQGCGGSQADARQGGGCCMASTSQGTNAQVPRAREPRCFLQLHAGHSPHPKQTAQEGARATPV